MPLRLLSAALFAIAASAQPYTISTFAGGGLPVNVPGTSASLYYPYALATDKAGNVFFGDGNSILRLDAATGVLTLVAGIGTCGFSGDDGLATSAQLCWPLGVVVDDAGNLYIVDSHNYRIRKVSNGVITTVAGNGSWGFGGDNGPASSAQLNAGAVAVDRAGNLYIADGRDSRIRKVSKGVITTVAGNGTEGFSGDGGAATGAQLSGPSGVAVDSAGDLYIADSANQRIRKVSNGLITTVAGNGTAGSGGDNGTATGAELFWPTAVAVDSRGNLYIAGSSPGYVRRVSSGVITTVAGGGESRGEGGPATAAAFGEVGGIAADSAGNVYIADTDNTRIRKVASAVISTVAGGGVSSLLGDGGPATSAQLWSPRGVAVGSAGNLYIGDWGNNRVREVSDGIITTLAGNGAPGFSGGNRRATQARLIRPWGVAVGFANDVFVADEGNGRVLNLFRGSITTVAGNGTRGYRGGNGAATDAQTIDPIGVAVDSAGNLYITDGEANVIRKVSNGVITTVAGNGTGGYSGDGSPATNAQLHFPTAVAVDSAGNLYIADTGNNVIRKVSKGVITTVVGNGTAGYNGVNGPATGAQLNEPGGVAVDNSGSLYVADNSRILKVSNGVITVIAGGGISGFAGDGGPAIDAGLSSPWGVAVDSAGKVYFSDSDHNRIRLLTPGTAPIISPSTAPVQPSSWISLYGTNLASSTTLWSGDFPMSLGGTNVSIDGKPAFLWYVSPTQINLQAPDDTVAGPVSVTVTTASGTATSTVTLAPYGPSFSLLGDGKHVAAEIAMPAGTGAYGGGTYDLLGPSNTFSYSTRPVKAGETLVLYGVGFGPTSPRVPAGQPFTGAAPTTSKVTITIGGVQAPVAFSGLTMAGLYQINVTVPPGTGIGDQPLAGTVGGVQTQPGPLVAVQ